ncbi:MAG: hypothetical protein ACLU99_01905 [Alphaproteobacteria bacterium]
MAFANKTSAAIGDAKKSVSEYVIKNKEKAEEKLKKLNEYKKQAEEYKKNTTNTRKCLMKTSKQHKTQSGSRSQTG